MKSPLETYLEPLAAEFPNTPTALAIVRGGTVSQLSSHGVSGDAAETITRIASMTKSFAAAAVLILRDERKLDLLDAVKQYLPELHGFDKVTIFHLLTMQAGLPTDDPWADQQLGMSDSDFETILQRPFETAAKPGEEYHYSNLGYMMLGRIISRVSGEHALSFITRRILEPLGMERTAWNIDGRENVTALALPPVPVRSDSAVFGGLWSTINDLARWMTFFTSAFHDERDEYESILSARSRRELMRGVAIVPPPNSTAPIFENVVYGYGLRRFSTGRLWTVGHSGGLPGFGSHFRWCNELKTGVIAWGASTYCPVWNACREIMKELVEAEPYTFAAIDPRVERKAEELIAIIKEWNDAAADEIFSSNFFKDTPRDEARALLKSVAADLANGSVSILPERGLGALLTSASGPFLSFSLAPTESARVQSVKTFK